MSAVKVGRVVGKKKLKIYLIGSLRNPEVPIISQKLRKLGFNVFDDWYAAGPEADDKWRDYEKGKGHEFVEGLDGLAADHVYQFDKKHLLDCDIAILYMKAGKSAHLELGWVLGIGFILQLLKMLDINSEKLNINHKRGYILLDDADRWDVMYKFADGVYSDFDNLKKELIRVKKELK